MKIERIQNKKFKDFFGKNIESIHLLVCANGAGKTTLLDLIGLTKNNRDELFELYEDNEHTKGWFALYKCGKDNEFYIEGFIPELLFDEIYCGKEKIHMTYSLQIKYNFREIFLVKRCFLDSLAIVIIHLYFMMDKDHYL